MLHDVLVPLDGSSLSTTVLAPLRRLLVASGGARVVLLGVVTTRGGPAAEREFEQVQHDLDKACAELSLGGELKASPRVVRGDPTEQILACADDLQADLIAMATHGRTGAARLVRGSIAESVLRRARIPVLFVNPHTMRTAGGAAPVRRILLPFDGDDPSLAVAAFTARLARHARAEVVIGRIGDPAHARSLDAAQPYEVSLQKAARALPNDVQVRGVLAFGDDPAAALLDLAERERVDVIAMTTHGRTGLARAWLGSVAEELARRAPVPVVVQRIAAPE